MSRLQKDSQKDNQLLKLRCGDDILCCVKSCPCKVVFWPCCGLSCSVHVQMMRESLRTPDTDLIAWSSRCKLIAKKSSISLALIHLREVSRQCEQLWTYSFNIPKIEALVYNYTFFPSFFYILYRGPYIPWPLGSSFWPISMSVSLLAQITLAQLMVDNTSHSETIWQRN